MPVVRTALVGLAAGAVAGFILALLRPRQRTGYVAPSAGVRPPR